MAKKSQIPQIPQLPQIPQFSNSYLVKKSEIPNTPSQKQQKASKKSKTSKRKGRKDRKGKKKSSKGSKKDMVSGNPAALMTNPQQMLFQQPQMQQAFSTFSQLAAQGQNMASFALAPNPLVNGNY